MLRILALAIVLASTSSCTKKDPVEGPRPPDNEPPSVEVSIRADPPWAIADGVSELRLAVAVSDSTGLMLAGREVTLESTVPEDLIEPTSGATKANGIFASTLSGTTPGRRILTARVGDVTATVVVALGLPSCGDELLVGGHPPVAATWPEFEQATMLLTGDVDSDGADDVVYTLFDPSLAFESNRIVVRLDGGARTGVETVWQGPMRWRRLADFDGDGLLDLAFTGYSGGLDVLLGNGDGTFRVGPLHWEEGGDIAWMDSASVEGDTRAHMMLITDSFTDEVSVGFRLRTLRLDDDGAWVVVAETEDASLAYGGSAGDFDRDGHADYLHSRFVSEGVNFWMGTADGTFDRRPPAPVPGTLVLVDDLDGDGAVDLLVWNGPVVRAWSPFEDDASSAGANVNSMPANHGWYGVGHWDDDGIRDVFSVSQEGMETELFVYPGEGDGRFGRRISLGLLPLSSGFAVAIADRAGGRSQVVQFSSNAIAIVRPGESSLPPPVLEEVATFVAGDFDGDGILDLATATEAGLVSLRSHDVSYPGDPVVSMHAGDIDGDGADEIAVLRRWWGGTSLSVIFPAAGIELPVDYLETSPVWAVTIADVDGDGLADVAVAAWESTFVLFSGGDGSFRRGPDIPVGAMLIAAGDFDGDGRTDLVVSGWQTSFLIGDGSGGFEVIGSSVSSVQALAVADLDLDGRSDVVLAGYERITMIHGNDLRSPSTIGAGGYKPVVTTGDFDGDGRPDVAVSGPGDVIAILWGAEGGFRSLGAFAGGPPATALAFGDFSGDGSRQLAVLGLDRALRLLPITCNAPPPP